jgi:pimeloyl-ACP methyl ester carboxylesterase
MGRELDRTTVGDVELEYETRGSGPPVLLIHAGGCADWFAPLLEEPALTGAHQVVSYHRVGYAGSSHRPWAATRPATRPGPSTPGCAASAAPTTGP